MSQQDDFGTFFAGLLVGGLVGAAVALLMAPQSGEETRTLIRDRGIELKDRAVEYSADARGVAEKALEEARVRADAAAADLRTRANEFAQLTSERATAFKNSLPGVGENTAE